MSERVHGGTPDGAGSGRWRAPDIDGADFQMRFLRPGVGRTNAIFRGGHAVVSSILLNNPPLSRARCVCVCVFLGAPQGEAGQPLPVAALGRCMANQDTCLATGPSFTVAPFVFRANHT